MVVNTLGGGATSNGDAVTLLTGGAARGRNREERGHLTVSPTLERNPELKYKFLDFKKIG
jgi:hypothetical protein